MFPFILRAPSANEFAYANICAMICARLMLGKPSFMPVGNVHQRSRMFLYLSGANTGLYLGGGARIFFSHKHT